MTSCRRFPCNRFPFQRFLPISSHRLRPPSVGPRRPSRHRVRPVSSSCRLSPAGHRRARAACRRPLPPGRHPAIARVTRQRPRRLISGYRRIRFDPIGRIIFPSANYRTTMGRLAEGFSTVASIPLHPWRLNPSKSIKIAGDPE